MSTKGFRVRDGLAESGVALEFAAPDITDALLISAYDLHHGGLPDAERLLNGSHHTTLYANPRLLVIDSGGYELLEAFESGDNARRTHVPAEFSREDFQTVVARLPRNERALLVVTYDHPEGDGVHASYETQRERAQEFAGANPDLLVDFLIKPPAESRFVDPRALTLEAPNLRAFAVIGVTEGELGDSLLDRLICIARLRELLDTSGAEGVPVHVFGGLDPILTPLYFMAGAEIFDGLTWLRYAYYDDNAVHPDELAPLTYSIESIKDRRELERQVANIRYLKDLKLRLERFAAEPERYGILGRHAERMREIDETLRARLRQGSGGGR